MTSSGQRGQSISAKLDIRSRSLNGFIWSWSRASLTPWPLIHFPIALLHTVNCTAVYVYNQTLALHCCPLWTAQMMLVYVYNQTLALVQRFSSPCMVRNMCRKGVQLNQYIVHNCLWLLSLYLSLSICSYCTVNSTSHWLGLIISH